MRFVEVFTVSLLSAVETVSLRWSCDCPKIRSNKICVMHSGCHQLWKSVAVFPVCVCVCVPLCKRVKRKPIFVDIWPLLIIPQATNKPQTHILSCLSCGASLLQSVMSNQCYRLLKGQVGGCFLRVDTWFSGPAITVPTITSLTCPPLIGLEQQSFMRLPLEVRGGQCGTKQQARHQSERRHCASANLKL